jgi:cell shape-determining protein MreD
LQARLPVLWWLGGVRLEFLPALVAYGALTCRRRGWALALAITAGACQDALSVAPVGNAIAGYTIAAFVLHALARNFDRDALWFEALAGALASVAVSIAALLATGGGRGAALKVVLLGWLSVFVTPLVFLALDYLRYRTKPA